MSPPGSSRFASRAAPLGLLLAGTLAGCGGPQSFYGEGGPIARSYGLLGNVMFVGGAIVLAAVIVAAAIAMFAPAGLRRTLAGRGFVVTAGIAFPTVVLTALLLWGLLITRDAVRAASTDSVRILVEGEQFWWRVTYLDQAGEPAFETANEIVLPVGRSAVLSLTSADVIHSFWAPAVGGKMDMIPGRINELTIAADRAGVWRGQCSEFCGAQHARMAFDVVALDEADYAAWLEAQEADAAEPRGLESGDGRDLFLAVGCSGCHTVRGTSAAGTLGPDLTHVAGRRTLAAGTLPNNVGTLAAWIASAQHLKAGAKMPSFDTLAGAELRALATWLSELR